MKKASELGDFSLGYVFTIATLCQCLDRGLSCLYL